MADSLETTRLERDRKLLECHWALRMVQEDLAYLALDEGTRAAVEAARVPIGGWVKGLARIEKALSEPLEGDEGDRCGECGNTPESGACYFCKTD